MRILIAHNYYQQAGGEDSVFQAECALLERAGHEVIRYEVRNDTIRGPVDAVRSAFDAPYSGARAREFYGLFHEKRPDIVHVHNFFPLITPAIFTAAQKLGIPTVMTLHNFRLTCAGAQLYRDGAVCELCIGGDPYQGAKHRCYRGSYLASLAVARMIDHHRKYHTWQSVVTRFIALTDFAREKFIEAGLPGNRLVVKPNFMDARDLPSRPNASARTEFLYAGRLSPEKGLAELLRAWASIDAPLTITGDGPDRERLEALAPPQVTFTGALPREETLARMANARALVVPSRWYEGFPMVVVEAFSMGLPVIASNIGSLGDLITPGANGALVDIDDKEGWRAAVTSLFTDDAMVAALSAGARQSYEAHYTAEENLKRLEAIYEDAIASARQTAQAARVRR